MFNKKMTGNAWMQFFITMFMRLWIILFWIAFLIGFILLSYVPKYFEPERSLSMYLRSDQIDESILHQFEQETGIKIYANYYESNEELVTKFEIAKDLSCDIILPSEYIVKTLAEYGFLKKIDLSRCDFIDRIYPEFLHQSFDPMNHYSLPLYWDILGLGYTKSYFKHGLPSHSWRLIFDEQSVPCKKISMIDDSREAIFLADTYFNFQQKMNQNNLEQIIKLFIEQKKWVGAYTDFQQGYFLISKTYPLVVSQREHIVREMIKHDDIAFVVPDEGSLLMITNVVVCAHSKKDDLIYQFLNYLYKHEILMHHCKKYCILPTAQDVFDNLPQDFIGVEGLHPQSKMFNHFKIFSNILTQKQINDIWIAFKSF